MKSKQVQIEINEAKKLLLSTGEPCRTFWEVCFFIIWRRHAQGCGALSSWNGAASGGAVHLNFCEWYIILCVSPRDLWRNSVQDLGRKGFLLPTSLPYFQLLFVRRGPGESNLDTLQLDAALLPRCSAMPVCGDSSPRRTVEEPRRLKHTQKKMTPPRIPLKRKIAAGAEKRKKSQTPDYITTAG